MGKMYDEVKKNLPGHSKGWSHKLMQMAEVTSFRICLIYFMFEFYIESPFTRQLQSCRRLP